mmetsp:Transcript_21736/g.51320  ORF Transcript_21736/g.51320 Transcript_21736/m.51320 type:complete len:270 (-) Transcript_21736:336-1145(-)
MTDNWDDGSDEEWDIDDDALDAKLGIKKEEETPKFDDEEDMALVEKAAAEKAKQADLKKKGSALAAKKQAEKDRQEEEEMARKQMAYEEEMLAHMTPDERKIHERQREVASDMAMAGDFLSDADNTRGPGNAAASAGGGGGVAHAGDKVVLTDMKDHMKHARKVAEAMKAHGKIHLATIFLKEVIQQSTDVLDDNAIQEIIKTCNVIKNEKVQAAKRKVKGQAGKSKKQEKTEKMKAMKIHDDVFGDSNQYDQYDEMADNYAEEYDDFF